MIDFNKLRESISIARNEILKPAKEQADVVKVKMLKKAFGEDFRQVYGYHVKGSENHIYGFHLHGVTILATCDQYQNLFIKEISGLPPIAGLQSFAEAVLYVFEDYKNPFSEARYPLRTVSCLMADLAKKFGHIINKDYAEEMIRIGDLYCENHQGFRKWALGSYPLDSSNLGSTPNLPEWRRWFPEISECEQQRNLLRKTRY